MALAARCRQILRIPVWFVVLSLTTGPRILEPPPVHDSLGPSVVQRSELAYAVTLRPAKRCGVDGWNKSSPAEPTSRPLELPKVGSRVQPDRATAVATSPVTLQDDRLRSPPRFA